MPLQALSLGLDVAVRKPQSGVVHGAFDHAIHRLMDSDMLHDVGEALLDGAQMTLRERQSSWFSTLTGASGTDACFGIGRRLPRLVSRD